MISPLLKRLRLLWDSITSTILLIPLLIILGFVLLTLLLFYLPPIEGLPPLPSPSPDRVNQLLATIASTSFSAGLILFSITMMVLALSAQAFGSRLLRHFLRRPYSQSVLGYFGGTFTFCLVTLLWADWVPLQRMALSLYLSLIFAVIGILLIIYFVHEVTLAIQAPTIISLISSELKKSVLKLQNLEEAEAEDRGPCKLGAECTLVRVQKGGYVLSISAEQVVQCAKEQEIAVEYLVRPGTYVPEGAPIAKIYGARQIMDEGVETLVRNAMQLGKRSQPVSDLEYSLRHLVNIALKALSPAQIDHFTCANCIDELVSNVSTAATRKFPSPRLRDDTGHIRVYRQSFTFEGMVDQAFNQIRQNSAPISSCLYVTLYFVESLARASWAISHAPRRACLLQQASLALEMLAPSLPTLTELDREAVEERRRLADEAATASFCQTSD